MSRHLVLFVVSAGGALGALARWRIQTVWPGDGPAAIPYATLIVNTLGGFLVGILMVLVTDIWTERRLLRPFLGIGVLGGFTTFSTYVMDVQQLLAAEAFGCALGYLMGTVGAVLSATLLGIRATRLATRRVRPGVNGSDT